FQDPVEVVEEGVAAVFGGFDDSSVLMASEREAVGALDAFAQEAFGGAGDVGWVVVGGVAQGCFVVRAGLGDAGDGVAEAVEDGDVLGQSDLVGCLVERSQVGVCGAAVGV